MQDSGNKVVPRTTLPEFNPEVAEKLAQEQCEQFRNLLEKSCGKKFFADAENLFKSKGLEGLENFERSLFDALALYSDFAAIEKHNWIHSLTDTELQIQYKEIFERACTKSYLDGYRHELLSWIDKVENGKALFVDCPMGIGKTYSIAKVLGQNPELSAIIFMPTKRLCRRLVQELKWEIVQRNPSLRFEFGPGVDEEADPEDLDEITGRYPISFVFTKEFLEDEVYFADGINDAECDHYDEIVKQYALNWHKKREICQRCAKQNTCRFLQHPIKMLKARIIITTHSQYDYVYKNKILSMWDRFDDPKRLQRRELFIIDEDMIISGCYSPHCLEREELVDFTRELSEFLLKSDFVDEIDGKVNQLCGYSVGCKSTSFIGPIDKDFAFPEEIKQAWLQSYPEVNEIIAEEAAHQNRVGNFLEMIESGIRYGIVVQKHGNIHKILFNNTRGYDLSKCPPHVFFDGTMLKTKFIGHKLKGVEFKRIKSQVKSPWDFTVSQNSNTDVTRRAFFREKNQVEKFVSRILEKHGTAESYFIVGNKPVINYLERYVRSQFGNYSIRLGYYGNLRGENWAQHCNIGMMIGSFVPSDAVEIAMALDLIQKKLPEKQKVRTENKFWDWKRSNKVRVYRKDYRIIQDLAEAYRWSEHRQAMARTRYLFHDVHFYVLSKESVDSYLKKYAKIIDDKYAEEIFPARAERIDSLYRKVVEKVLLLTEEHGPLRAADIQRLTKHSPRILRKHLQRMIDERLITMGKGRRFSRP